MTRQEHLDWCKQRALVDMAMFGVIAALGSMASDLKKHPETTGVYDGRLKEGLSGVLAGDLNTTEKMQEFIEGFR